MSHIGKIIRVKTLPPTQERETNVIYQVAEPGSPIYTDYAIDEAGNLKTHAVTEGSIPLELSDTHLSISDQNLISEGITTQAEYNITTKEKVDKKLDIPLTEGNAQDYPKIIGMDDNGNIAKLPAGDLGKNVANSSLTSVAGAGLTMGANWTLNTSGLYYFITGLNDVSADPTFNIFLSQNTSGRIGRSNGKQLFLNLPNTLSEAEKTAWKTSMNGGWTTNTMSVALISPLVINNSTNNNTWVSLKGANLNLNPASFTIQLMNEAGTTVIVTVPNNQVQLYPNGIDLVFYYNFSTLPLGKYRVRLWNGVAYYITNSNIAIHIVDNVVNIDTSAITWQIASDPGNHNTYTEGNGSIAKIKDQYSGSSPTSTPIVCIKSSPLHDVGDNFYIELNINFTVGAISGIVPLNSVPARIGLTYSDFNISSLVFNTVSFLAYKTYSARASGSINDTTAGINLGADGVLSYSQKLTFIKNGNILYLTWSFNNTVYQTSIDDTKVLSIIAQFPHWENNIGNVADLTILKAYKF